MRSVRVSARTGEGLAFLRQSIADVLGVGAASDASVPVNARHRALLERAAAALDEAGSLADAAAPPGAASGDSFCDVSGFDAVLVAQRLREAAEALGAIAGRDVSEDVLDAVFSRFCIGK